MPTRIKHHAASFKPLIMAHKAVAVLIGVGILSGVYGTLHASAVSGTRYILATVSRGSVVSSVTGTGTVEASDQIDVISKASGQVTGIKVKPGDQVTIGQTLAEVDPTNALNDLKSAQIAYNKLTEPADQSTLISARQAVTDAENNEVKDYDTAWSDLAGAYADLGAVIQSEHDMFYTNSGFFSVTAISALGTTAANDREKAGAEFDTASRGYQSLVDEFKGASRQSATSTIDGLLRDTSSVATTLLESLKDAQVAVTYVKSITTGSFNQADVLSAANTAASTISSWTSETAGHVSAIQSDEAAIAAAPDALASAQASLQKVEQGADPLDVESSELSLSEKRQAYDDTFVKAPFSGTVGKVDVQVGDNAGSGTVIATVVSANDVTNVSLDEVDAAKVKVGDKASLTFDAVPGLTISGTVSELDLVGTVTQGVVDYNAKITFDTNDARIRPSMSVTADIITASADDVLVVPSSAVKTRNGRAFVQVFNPPLSSTGGAQGVVSKTLPQAVPVEVGLSGDTTVEIVSGLAAGDQIVARTISSTATPAASQSGPSLFGGGSARGGGGAGAGRALGR